jgi:Arc/MetJ-type ribon-helix-helix transcriptional regulator
MVADNDKKRYSVTLTTAYVKALDQLIEVGIYMDHQDAIRDALRRLFQYHGIEPFSEKETAAPSEP